MRLGTLCECEHEVEIPDRPERRTAEFDQQEERLK